MSFRRDRRPPVRAGGRTRARLVLGRVFTVLAAACLVAAIAIAMLAPLGMTLGLALQRLDDTGAEALRRRLPAAVWHVLLVPFLQRPAWIVPAMLGLVGAGLAVTIRRPAAPPRGRRR